MVTNGSAMHKISSKLTLTETFNLGCDIDLEHSNPTFSLDTSLLMMIYTQIEFGCKRLTDSLTFRLMVVNHNTKFGYKRLPNKHSAEWEQICVTSVTSLTPEDTTLLSLF